MKQGRVQGQEHSANLALQLSLPGEALGLKVDALPKTPNCLQLLGELPPAAVVGRPLQPAMARVLPARPSRPFSRRVGRPMQPARPAAMKPSARLCGHVKDACAYPT